MTPAAPEIDPGAARQTWRAALALWVVVVAGLTLFHAFPAAMPWGGLGFYAALALAGYATTRLMTPTATAAPRLVEAWARMALWLVPSLVVVVAAVVAAGLALSPPADLRNQVWTGAWTLVGLGGNELWKQGAYDPRTSGDLLLHGWAPGVAAQLAVGWTLVLAVLTRLRLRSQAGVVAVLGVALSFMVDIWMRRHGLGLQDFFLAPGRAWAFFAGAAWALAAVRFQPSGVVARVLDALSRLGTFALPFSLWVWPLLAGPRLTLARDLTPAETIAALAAAALLAAATRYGLQRPLERRLGGRPAAALMTLAAAVAATGVACAAIYMLHGLPGRASSDVLAEQAGMQRLPPMQAVCHTEGDAPPAAAGCTIPAGAAPQVVLWGNSHGSHLGPAVFAWAAERGLAARQATRSGCLPVLKVGDLADAGCVRFNRAAVAEWGRAPRPSVILVGAGWTVQIDRAGGPPARQVEAVGAAVDEMITALRASVGPEARIVLLGTTPDYRFSPGACHARRAFLRLDTARCDRAIPANAALAQAVDARLERVAAKHPGVSVFRPWTALCDGQTCRTRSGGVVWYSDTSHMTEAGGRAQLEALRRVLDRALASGGTGGKGVSAAP